MNINDLPNLCPICGEEPISIARCINRHSVCNNGHSWHTEFKTRKELKDGWWHAVENYCVLVVDEYPNRVKK